MFYCPAMTEFDARFDDIDVESILARVEKREPFIFSRRRCIYQAPEFTQRLPAHETVEEGSTVTFGCKVLGFPKPTVTWYKDDDVIGTESRAGFTADENGVHSLKLQDVSKCDAGSYKISATNLEGSSSSSLCITVKAKSKNRNRKKKKTRAVACAPLFPAIVEHEAEERRETLEVEQQDDSPLTPIYSNKSRRSPVTWPAFLGDWAYNTEEGIHHDVEDLEIECEDVFENESDHPAQESLTFVSSAYAHMNENTDEHKVVEGNSLDVQSLNKANSEHLQDIKSTRTDAGNNKNSLIDISRKQSKDVAKPPNTLNLLSTVDDDYKILTINDIINNNKDRRKDSVDTLSTYQLTENNISECKVPPKEIEDKCIVFNPSEVSQISVNRSYATGNATFSVATRSSPYRTLRERSKVRDCSTLQNQNNERLLQKMKQSARLKFYWNILSTFTWSCSTEDWLAEVLLLLCGCTFLALCLDLSPSTFVFDIFVAIVIKFALSAILSTYDRYLK